MHEPLQGVFAAAITPLRDDFSIDLNSIPPLLEFLAGRGCHGALLFGTTGEGPSFRPAERIEALRVAQGWRQAHPGFQLLAGTGTPSLQETIELTRAAFELGVDGVVTLPPYYFRKVSDEGLFAWFSQVIQRAVPDGKAFFGYHFPNVSGVALSPDLLDKLKTTFPARFTGIKDSSGDPDFVRLLGKQFGSELTVLTGNDSLFSLALTSHASGCITAMANLYSPDLRQVWDSFIQGDMAIQEQAQSRLNEVRAVLGRYPPFPPLIKALISRQYAFPRWPVCPPLIPLSDEFMNQSMDELKALG
jgi:4-hydroxy-tetrahydrodipicolinate synthase